MRTQFAVELRIITLEGVGACSGIDINLVGAPWLQHYGLRQKPSHSGIGQFCAYLVTSRTIGMKRYARTLIVVEWCREAQGKELVVVFGGVIERGDIRNAPLYRDPAALVAIVGKNLGESWPRRRYR